MDTLKVKDLSTPLDQYTTVFLTSSLYEAFIALEKAIRGEGNHPLGRPRDFAVLVTDNRPQVIGRLVVWDLLQGLKTGGVEQVDSLSMIEDYGAWSHAANLTTKVRNIQVQSLMKSLHKEEYIDEYEPLSRAVDRLVRHRFLSLIVTRNDLAVGVLRVVDVFSHFCDRIKGEKK